MKIGNQPKMSARALDIKKEIMHIDLFCGSVKIESRGF